MSTRQGGFTLSELLMVIILTSFFSILILTFTFEYWRYAYLLQADQETLITRLDAGDILREEIGTSTGLITQNSITDAHTLVPDPAYPSGDYWLPIHATPASVNMPSAGSFMPLIYFSRYSFDGSGNYIMNGSQPYEDEYMLYLDGSTKSLKQRTLVNPSASGDRLKTSCPPAQASPSCPDDKTIATDLSSAATRYFSRTGNLIDYTSVTDPITGQYIGPDYPLVEVVELTINLSKKPTFQKTNATSNSTIIRIALRNA